MSTQIVKALCAQFPANAVSWRAGSTIRTDEGMRCKALAYIDARDVMGRLDAVLGPTNWSDEYVETAKGVMLCKLSLRIDGEWITKTDGAGETDVEAEKGKISDAFKRAAVKWGIGRYLYDLPTPWVEYDEKRKQITPAGHKQLEAALVRFAGQAQAPVAKADPAPAPAKETQAEASKAASFVEENRPAPEAPAAPEAKASKPSYVPPGGKVLTAEERKARDAAWAAKDAAAKAKESTETAEHLLVRLDGFWNDLADPDLNLNAFNIEFNAFEQTRMAAWNQMANADKARVKAMVLKVKEAHGQRRGSKQKAA